MKCNGYDNSIMANSFKFSQQFEEMIMDKVDNLLSNLLYKQNFIKVVNEGTGKGK
jgi:flagellar biosynthesis/type III secretory pathway M-ring protein FliF/YscJ